MGEQLTVKKLLLNLPMEEDLHLEIEEREIEEIVTDLGIENVIKTENLLKDVALIVEKRVIGHEIVLMNLEGINVSTVDELDIWLVNAEKGEGLAECL